MITAKLLDMWFTRVLTKHEKQDNNNTDETLQHVYDKWNTITAAQATAAIAKELGKAMRRGKQKDGQPNYHQVNNRGELMNKPQKIHAKKITKKGIERTKQILENRVCIVCSYEASTIPLLREHKMQCHSY